MSQLPNLLTLLRIGATPVLILLLDDNNYAAAFWVFLVAGITDGLDGFIAKRFNYVSKLGAILDPVADKILLLSCFVMLTILGDVPFWLMVMIGFRDLLIVGGYLVLVTVNGVATVSPSRVSKLNTVVQITLVIVVLIHNAAWLDLVLLREVLIGAALLTTVVSGAHYLWVWGIRKDPGATSAGRDSGRPSERA